MVTHLIANQRLLVKGYARSSRASVAYFVRSNYNGLLYTRGSGHRSYWIRADISYATNNLRGRKVWKK